MSNRSYSDTDMATNMSSDQQELLWFSARELIIYLVLYLLCILGIAANVVVCVVMVRRKSILRTLSSLMLFHLSLTEILDRCTVLPLAVAQRYLQMTELTWCNLANFATHTVSTTLFASLAVIAVDRYITITRPLQSWTRKPKGYRYITAIWLYALVCSIPHFFSNNISHMNFEGGRTNYTLVVCTPSTGLTQQISSTVYLVVGFILPLVIVSVAYTKIAVYLRKRSQQGIVHNRVMLRSRQKALRMLVLSVLSFAFFWGPYFVCRVVWSYDATKISKASFVYTSFFQIFSSLANPFIYGFYNWEFRQGFVALCRCAKCSCCYRGRRKKLYTVTVEK